LPSASELHLEEMGREGEGSDGKQEMVEVLKAVVNAVGGWRGDAEEAKG